MHNDKELNEILTEHLQNQIYAANYGTFSTELSFTILDWIILNKLVEEK